MLIHEMVLCLAGYVVLMAVLKRFAPAGVRRVVGGMLLALWTAAVVYLTLGMRDPVLNIRIQLIPFADVASDGVYSIVENMLMFLPLCGFLRLVWPTLRGRTCLLIALAASLLIELVQLGTGRGICDVDDLIANVAGALVGIGLEWVTGRGRL